MITIVRLEEDGATLGTMLFEGRREFSLATLEPPWKDNKPRESCIPGGTYRIKRMSGKKYKNVFHVLDVPQGRTGILVGGHVGNTVLDTDGCILLGECRGELDGRPAVLCSTQATEKFNEIMRGIDEATLTIVNRQFL